LQQGTKRLDDKAAGRKNIFSIFPFIQFSPCWSGQSLRWKGVVLLKVQVDRRMGDKATRRLGENAAVISSVIPDLIGNPENLS